MPLAVIDLFEISIVRDILDALLGGNDVVVARHDRDGTKLARYIVPIEILPGVISILSLRSTARVRACLTAFRARRNSRVERTGVQSHEIGVLFDPTCDPCTNRLRRRSWSSNVSIAGANPRLYPGCRDCPIPL